MTILQRLAWRRAALAAFMALAWGSVSGCELVGFFAGHGEQKALFTLPPTARVLVLVDVRPEISAPPTWATTLGDRITSHLYRNKAIEHPVGQDRLIEMQRDAAEFRKLGVADIAARADADVVMVVYVVLLQVTSTVDESVTQGQATVLVKVISKDGTKLWPGDSGYKVEAKVDPGFTSDHDKQQVYSQLSDLLALRVGRMFHSYDLEDDSMIK